VSDLKKQFLEILNTEYIDPIEFINNGNAGGVIDGWHNVKRLIAENSGFAISFDPKFGFEFKVGALKVVHGLKEEDSEQACLDIIDFLDRIESKK